MSITTEPIGEPIALVLNEESGAMYNLYLDKNAEPEEKFLLDEKLPEHLVSVVTEQLNSGLSFNEVQNMLKSAEGGDEEGDLGETKEFEAYPEENVIISMTREPMRVTMFGETGSGKSRLGALLGFQYSRMFPDRKIIVFCAQDEDPAFYYVEKDEEGNVLRDKNNRLILQIDEAGEPIPQFKFQEIILGDGIDDGEMLKRLNNMTLDDVEDSLIIFDDVDNIAEPKLCKAIHKLVNLCYANGRRRNIHTIYLGHVIFAGIQNKVIHAETTKYVFFPKSNAPQILNFFNKMMKFPMGMSRRFSGMNVDWLCLVKATPMYFVYPKGIMII